MTDAFSLFIFIEMSSIQRPLYRIALGSQCPLYLKNTFFYTIFCFCTVDVRLLSSRRVESVGALLPRIESSNEVTLM